MVKPYDTIETITEQDYGPFLARLNLYEVGGQIFIEEESGYGKPYDRNWYMVSEKPTRPLHEICGSWEELPCGSGSLDDFSDELGMKLTKCERPHLEEDEDRNDRLLNI